MYNVLSYISSGIYHLTTWQYILLLLVYTHITILSITIFLHRCQSHKSLTLHPIASHFFRFWLWLTTGAVTKEFVAIHRKHHAFSDKQGDPHSPQVFGIGKVLSEGAELYRDASLDADMLEKYGVGTPDDWIEKHIYTKHHYFGLCLMWIINITMFGLIGVAISAIQMIWMPIFAAGIINGVGHYFGYRNFETPDHARNILPFGIIIGGEELHNNHHAFATSAKFSVAWYEFDYGYMWIKLLSYCKLAKIKKTIPVINSSVLTEAFDTSSLESIVSNKYLLTVKFVKIIKKECQEEIKHLLGIDWKKIKTILIKDYEILSPEEKNIIKSVSNASRVMSKVFEMRKDLSRVWARSSLSKDELIKILQNWCNNAETSSIASLQKYALCLRSIS